MKTNGFKKCKFCILGKHINLYQAVTFCINDYLLYANTKISFLWSFSGLGAHTSTFQVFFFSCTSIKICQTVINDFTMHLIISKLLRRQKCRQKRKNNEIKRRQREKRNCLQKCFHLFHLFSMLVIRYNFKKANEHI